MIVFVAPTLLAVLAVALVLGWKNLLRSLLFGVIFFVTTGVLGSVTFIACFYLNVDESAIGLYTLIAMFVGLFISFLFIPRWS
jgi:TctA family transporter